MWRDQLDNAISEKSGIERGSDLEGDDVQETGTYDESGNLKRPWCPETRILEHKEMVTKLTLAKLESIMINW